MVKYRILKSDLYILHFLLNINYLDEELEDLLLQDSKGFYFWVLLFLHCIES